MGASATDDQREGSDVRPLVVLVGRRNSHPARECCMQAGPMEHGGKVDAGQSQAGPMHAIDLRLSVESQIRVGYMGLEQ